MSETVDRGLHAEDAGPSSDIGHSSADAAALTWRALKWLGLSLAALVGMAQVGSIVQEAIPSGALSVTTLYAPGQVVSGFAPTSLALREWADASLQFGSLSGWLYLHLVFDGLFIAGYALLGFTLLPKERERVTRYMLTALIVADIAEDLMAALAFTRIIGHHPPVFAFTVLLHLTTVAKWLAALVLLVRLAFRAWDYARHAIGRVFSALWEQRFSVVVVIFLAVLTAGRGPDVLEQMPDVQRSWLTVPGMGWVHAAVALIAQLLLAVLLLFLGRMRTWRAKEKFSGKDDRADPRYLPWIVFPAVLAVLALGLWLADGAKIEPGRLAVAIAVPTLVAASSIAIAVYHRHRRDSSTPPATELVGPVGQPGQVTNEPGQVTGEPGQVTGRPERRGLAARPMTLARAGLSSRGPRSQPVGMVTDYRKTDSDGVQVLGHSLPEPQPDNVASVRTAGDALAVAVVAVTGLGLVRSFTALAILAGDGYTTAAWVAVALGIAVATFSWPLANGPVRAGLRKLAALHGPVGRFANWARQGRLDKKSERWPWLVAGAPFLIADVCLLFVPLWTTHWLGVLGTTVIAAGTLAVVLAVLAYLAQTQRPLPLFRMIRLNVTPVITLLAAIVTIGAVADSSPVVHEIRGPVAAGHPDGTSLLQGLQSWLDTPAGACAVPAAAGTRAPVRVRPLILVAAAGGGIRAAWWTEHALADLAATPCGRNDVFAVSSVSGSSIGMAVLDSAPTTQAADADLTKIAGPDALAAGIDGMLLHDMIAGFSGLDLAAAQMPPGQRFGDRADLIESAWQSEDGSLKQAFPLRQPALTWRLLFNSTDADSGCRAVIADRPLPAGPSSPDHGGLTCDLRSAVPGGGSFDFFAKLPCMQNIATVTAAMLSARFPFITPSGVVTSCQNNGALAGQFVDGGYVDSSGLITLADLIPSLTAAIRGHNAAAVAQAGPGQPVTLVVPVVIYLGNSPRPVPADTSASLIQELFVPPDAQSAAARQSGLSDTLLQRIQGMLGNGEWLQCVPAQADCAAAQSAAGHTVPYQVIFVSPRTEPGISTPLGWTLSAASRNALSKELSEEEDPASRCTNEPQPLVCQPGVGRMADLIHLVQSG